jgi:hypothetical protein
LAAASSGIRRPSSTFAAHVGKDALTPLGAFSLKGVAAPQTVYGLA